MANVLSQAHSAPASRAIRAIAATSTMASNGLDGVSTHTRRVRGRTAPPTAAGSVMSTKLTSMPHGITSSRRSRAVPW